MEGVWIRNGLVWTGGAEPRVLAGGVLCRGERVEAIGDDTALEERARGARQIDAGGRLVLPGWINAHMHLYSTFARGMALAGAPPADFNQILEKLWWRLDKALRPEDLDPSAEVVLLDALRAGVTTLVDHHASPGAVDGSLDALAEASHRVGVRLCTCFEVSDRDGVETTRAAIRENLRFAERVRDDPLCAAMFGLHASFTLSGDTLDRCAADGAAAGLAFHVHVAEALSDADDARRRGHPGALARLHRHGVITPGSLAIHCVHTLPGEWDLLREARAFCVHNPQSNLNNAVGAAPVADMIAAGVPVGIGTDGMQADVRQDLRVAFLLGHHRSGDPRTMWAEVPAMLEANRAIASDLFGLELGTLAPGAAADVVIADYLPPTDLTADNFAGHLLFGLYQAPAHTVLVAGRSRLAEGRFVDLDPAEVAARAREHAGEVWKRI